MSFTWEGFNAYLELGWGPTEFQRNGGENGAVRGLGDRRLLQGEEAPVISKFPYAKRPGLPVQKDRCYKRKDSCSPSVPSYSYNTA